MIGKEAKNKLHTFEEVKDQYFVYINDPKDRQRIEKSYLFAMKAHEGQMRKSGEPYIHHLIEVCYILTQLQCGPSTLIAGLLHDIGRFEQARRYGTFVDSLSVDHAELSTDLLFAEGLADRFPQDGLPEDWRNIAETAVRQHNKLKPAETPDDRTRRFIDLIRDADKTDIFRVIATIPFEDRVGSSKANFTETEEASPEVMACVLEHRCVPSRIRHSRFEGHISHCCMAFEMVFEISRKTVKEEGWLLALLAETDEQGKPIWTRKEAEQLRIVRREIENAWGVSLEQAD